VDLYPAIDVRAGRVVRMRRDDAHSSTLYHYDPFAIAERYVREGARWVHVVDQDRVFGFGEQTALIRELARRLAARLQAGGGITTAEEAGALLEYVVERVIVRGAAAQGPGGLAALARQCGAARLALAVDARDGMVDLGDGAGAGLAGAVVGRALLDGRFTLREALACSSS